MAEKGARGVERTTPARAALGAAGERLAALWLESHGLRVLERNWHCRYGELDLIAEQADELVFVEVKTRRGTALGAPEEAITPAKRRRLLLAAQTYLDTHALTAKPYRLDVLAVELSASGAVRDVRHYPNAIEEEV